MVLAMHNGRGYTLAVVHFMCCQAHYFFNVKTLDIVSDPHSPSILNTVNAVFEVSCM